MKELKIMQNQMVRKAMKVAKEIGFNGSGIVTQATFA